MASVTEQTLRHVLDTARTDAHNAEQFPRLDLPAAAQAWARIDACLDSLWVVLTRHRP